MSDRLSIDWSWVVGHVASVGAILGSLAGVIPTIGALIAATFYAVQLYQTKTVQKWVRNRHRRQVAKYRSRIHELESEMEYPPEVMEEINGARARIERLQGEQATKQD